MFSASPASLRPPPPLQPARFSPPQPNKYDLSEAKLSPKEEATSKEANNSIVDYTTVSKSFLDLGPYPQTHPSAYAASTSLSYSPWELRGCYPPPPTAYSLPSSELRSRCGENSVAGTATTIYAGDSERRSPPLMLLPEGGCWPPVDYFGRFEEKKSGETKTMSPSSGGAGEPYPLSQEAMYGQGAGNYYHAHHHQLASRGYASHHAQYQEGAFNLNINVNLNIHPSGECLRSPFLT
jgi:hypothetical protein